MTNSGSDSVAGTGVGGTGFGFGRAGSLKPRSGLMRTMLALVIGVPRSYRPFRGQWRAMRPTTIQPITRAAMLRPKTQLRTADSGKGSIGLERLMSVVGCSREIDRQPRSQARARTPQSRPEFEARPPARR